MRVGLCLKLRLAHGKIERACRLKICPFHVWGEKKASKGSVLLFRLSLVFLKKVSITCAAVASAFVKRISKFKIQNKNYGVVFSREFKRTLFQFIMSQCFEAIMSTFCSICNNTIEHPLQYDVMLLSILLRWMQWKANSVYSFELIWKLSRWNLWLNLNAHVHMQIHTEYRGL